MHKSMFHVLVVVKGEKLPSYKKWFFKIHSKYCTLKNTDHVGHIQYLKYIPIMALEKGKQQGKCRLSTVKMVCDKHCAKTSLMVRLVCDNTESGQ